MSTEYNWNRRKVRYRCALCNAETKWFYVCRLPEIGETVESWRDWWSQLHYEVIHPTTGKLDATM